MFQGKIRSDFMKAVIDATSILVDEAKFKFDSDGLYGRMVDPAHVGMIDFRVRKEAFDEYECEKETEIGIDLEKLRGILKIASAGDIIGLKYDKKEGRLEVEVGNLKRKMGLLDTSEMPDTKIPSLELPAEIVVSTAEVHQAIRAAEAISDHVTLMADKESFKIKAEGDTDVVELILSKEQLYSIKCDEPVKSMFPLDYLSDMVKLAKSNSEELTINLGNDYPLKMAFGFAGDYIKMMYLLAPRIES
ncbi:MAG: proliferating cell nuclear antigen (pcna) [Thermoplasmata archaeon]|nr:proliferating cell nuclear antigen (pcna) [Thermoplasmata archaeon]